MLFKSAIGRVIVLGTAALILCACTETRVGNFNFYTVQCDRPPEQIRDIALYTGLLLERDLKIKFAYEYENGITLRSSGDIDLVVQYWQNERPSSPDDHVSDLPRKEYTIRLDRYKGAPDDPQTLAWRQSVESAIAKTACPVFKRDTTYPYTYHTSFAH